MISTPKATNDKLSAFDGVDLDTILLQALKEKENALSNSPLLEQFQRHIDVATDGYTEINQRLGRIADVAKSFTSQQNYLERIAKIMP